MAIKQLALPEVHAWLPTVLSSALAGHSLAPRQGMSLQQDGKKHCPGPGHLVLHSMSTLEMFCWSGQSEQC